MFFQFSTTIPILLFLIYFFFWACLRLQCLLGVSVAEGNGSYQLLLSVKLPINQYKVASSLRKAECIELTHSCFTSLVCEYLLHLFKLCS